MTELVTAREAAERLGIEVRTMRKWRYRYPTFPKPVQRVAFGLPFHYKWAEVKAFVAYLRSTTPSERPWSGQVEW